MTVIQQIMIVIQQTMTVIQQTYMFTVYSQTCLIMFRQRKCKTRFTCRQKFQTSYYALIFGDQFFLF
jgi:hypothetical protein